MSKIPPAPLRSPAQVDEILKALAPAPAPEKVTLAEAAGRLLLTPVRADRDGPPFDRAMLDGIALRVSDWHSDGLPIAGSQLAGVAPMTLPAGACCEIMTGAVVPTEADCIIGYEDVTIDAGRAGVAREELEAGNAIHRRGSDFPAGAELLAAGTVLSSRALAVAASCGVSELTVARRPRVGILATGDEVIPIHATPEPWQIRRSNATYLAAALAQAGGDVIRNEHATDHLEITIQALRELAASCDVIVTAGGIALGERDFLPQALETIGAESLVRGVAQRPGKPFGIWRVPGGPIIFTLPGNPMSVAVTCSRYLRKFFYQWQGLPFSVESVSLTEPRSEHPRLTCFLPVEVAGALQAMPRPLQNSGDLAGAMASTGFVEIPAQTSVAEGDRLCYYPWL